MASNEHPKSLLELLADSREAIEGYCLKSELSFNQAALVLIFNELRCIHWHFDRQMEVENGSSSKSD